MESALEILLALLLWRLLLCVGLSAVLAYFLSQTFEVFTAGYCLTLVLFGTAFGIIWQSRAESKVGLFATVPPTPISKPVACLGLWFIGVLWGGWASWFFGSAFHASVVLVFSVALVGLWYRFVLRRAVSLSYLAFAGISLLSGLATLLLLKALNA